MKIESAAGEFEFEIETLKVDGSELVLTGTMGVWEAETVMSRADMVKFLKLTFGSPAFWIYLIKLPFGGGSKNQSNETKMESNP